MITQQQLNSPRLTMLPNLYFPPFYAREILVTLFNDVTIVCSVILVGKPLHMCRQSADGCLCTRWHPCQLTILTESMKCRHFISKPVFVPVTYIWYYIYCLYFTDCFLVLECKLRCGKQHLPYYIHLLNQHLT